MGSRFRGPLRAWRVADSRYPILSGAGAAQFGGRWNSPGRAIVYAAETYSGALLEKIASVSRGGIPKYQVYVEITVPQGIGIEIVDFGDVPGWDASDPQVSRAFGDRWLDERRSAVLIVPSIVARVERNVAINPAHQDFARIRGSDPKPVVWDTRLFSRQ